MNNGIYVHDPMENSKAARDIVVNPDAVYGYSPNPDSGRIGKYASSVDWTDSEQVAKATQRREIYHNKNDEIHTLAQDMKKQGYSTEEIARATTEQRNANRLNDYANDPERLSLVKESNLKTYGNESGPTADYLYSKYGSWEKVVEKSTGSNPGMDACCGLYDKYYHTYNSTQNNSYAPTNEQLTNTKREPDFDGLLNNPQTPQSCLSLDQTNSASTAENAAQGASNALKGGLGA